MYRYNAIPQSVIGSEVLEIGLNEELLLQSKIADKIKQAKYLGIDIVHQNNEHLEAIQTDILCYDISHQRFDTIIMLDVLEHIHFREWEILTKKLKDGLKPNGYIIITVPIKQKISNYIYERHSNYYQCHTIFGINKKILHYFFEKATIKTIYTFIFNQDQKNIIHATVRFLKRVIRHKFNRTTLNPVQRRYLLIWKKGVGK